MFIPAHMNVVEVTFLGCTLGIYTNAETLKTHDKVKLVDERIVLITRSRMRVGMQGGMRVGMRCRMPELHLFLNVGRGRDGHSDALPQRAAAARRTDAG
jgi:hypothetical protein